MFKSVAFSTIFMIAALQASADPGIEHDLSMLPPDVAAHIVLLQQYGDRFEPAIRAILLQHAKPSSGFDGCVDGDEGEFSSLVQS